MKPLQKPIPPTRDEPETLSQILKRFNIRISPEEINKQLTYKSSSNGVYLLNDYVIIKTFFKNKRKNLEAKTFEQGLSEFFKHKEMIDEALSECSFASTPELLKAGNEQYLLSNGNAYLVRRRIKEITLDEMIINYLGRRESFNEYVANELGLEETENVFGLIAKSLSHLHRAPVKKEGHYYFQEHERRLRTIYSKEFVDEQLIKPVRSSLCIGDLRLRNIILSNKEGRLHINYFDIDGALIDDPALDYESFDGLTMALDLIKNNDKPLNQVLSVCKELSKDFKEHYELSMSYSFPILTKILISNVFYEEDKNKLAIITLPLFKQGTPMKPTGDFKERGGLRFYDNAIYNPLNGLSIKRMPNVLNYQLSNY